MKKAQWIVAATAVLLTIGLYALTQNAVFGHNPKKPSATTTANAAADSHEGHDHGEGVIIDTILFHAKEALSPQQLTRINFLESSITRGDVTEQKTHVFHQLAKFWKDTAHIFEPFAWYTAEAARLENSEKSLTFAAHLFLNNLKSEGSPQLKDWKMHQAQDLFERSLRINPANDSSKVGLGATILFGGTEAPMEGISKIREVVERDSLNVYAQITLGQASMISGQLDKAIERFEKVAKLQPNNLEAYISLADVYERKGEKQKAIEWYKRSLPLIEIEGLKKEVDKRINELSK